MFTLYVHCLSCYILQIFQKTQAYRQLRGMESEVATSVAIKMAVVSGVVSCVLVEIYRYHTLVRHCATSRKVAGSIPVGVNWNFLLT